MTAKLLRRMRSSSQRVRDFGASHTGRTRSTGEPPALVTHTANHHDVSIFREKRVLVAGSQSALESAVPSTKRNGREGADRAQALDSAQGKQHRRARRIPGREGSLLQAIANDGDHRH
jgi:hypothetical protein